MGREAAILEELLIAHAAMLRSLDRINRMVLVVAREHEVCRRLTTVPGVGAIVAPTYIAAIEDPARFSKSRSVGALLGMVPRKHQSGEVDRNGRITKTGDSEVWSMLFEASHVMLHRVKSWVVERSFAWLNQFRRLAIRYERRADIHQALVTLGCALICMNQISRFC